MLNLATVVWYINVKDAIGLGLIGAFFLFLGVLWVLDLVQTRRRRRRYADEMAPPADPECSDCHVSHFTRDGKHRQIRGPS